MKIFTTILTTATLLFLTIGCVNEDPAYKNQQPDGSNKNDGYGYLSLAEMNMQVVVETETAPDDLKDSAEGKTTRGETNKAADTDLFIVEILDAAGKPAYDKIPFGELKAQIGAAGHLELPVGNYTLRVNSDPRANADIPPVEWEAPAYSGAQDFIIEKGQTTSLQEVVCTLSNIKVTFSCSKDLADRLTEQTKVTVSMEQASIDFAKTETRAAYFRPQAEENTLKLHLQGAFVDSPDKPVQLTKSIPHVKAGQWRKLTLVITHADKGDIKLDIQVNDFIQDDEIQVNGPDNPSEPEYPVAPTLVCTGHDLSKPLTLTAAQFDKAGNYILPLDFDISSANGIASMVVTIASDNTAFNEQIGQIGGPAFDLCTVSENDPAFAYLSGLGLPLGDAIKGATAKQFDMAPAMKQFYPALKGIHSLTFQLTDTKGLSTTATLTLTVSGESAPAPTIEGVGFNIEETQTPSGDKDTMIDITAQSGIRSLCVTIDCDKLKPDELGGIGIPAHFDLCNITGFTDSNGQVHTAQEVKEAIRSLGFPLEEEVRDKTSMRLTIGKMFTGLLGGFPGKNNFIIEVTENNGMSATKTLKFFVAAK